MRGTSDTIATAGLTEEARQALRTDVYSYRKFFKIPFGDPEYCSSVSADHDSKVTPTLAALDAVEDHVQYVEEIADRYVKAFLIKSRKRVEDGKAEMLSTQRNDVFNPALRYLLGAQTAFRHEEFEKEIAHLGNEARNHLAYLSRAAKSIGKFSQKEFSHYPSPPILEKQHRKSNWRFWKRWF